MPENNATMNHSPDLSCYTFLNQQEVEAIEAAVAQAEATTSGEIKVLIIERSRVGLYAYFILLCNRLVKPTLKYLIKPRKTRRENADIRALAEFFRLGVHKTEEQTGILIQICLQARWVSIIADKSINEKVDKESWTTIRNLIIEGIVNDKRGEGICNAVTKCGELLATHFPIQPNDINEIKNRVEFKF